MGVVHTAVVDKVSVLISREARWTLRVRVWGLGFRIRALNVSFLFGLPSGFLGLSGLRAVGRVEDCRLS